MKSLSNLLQEFDGRKKSISELEASFREIAKAAIYGGHFLVNNKLIIKIHEVEFYFHSENPQESTIYDWGMYHRNSGGEQLDYFPVGSLHPHKSGVDVTFEREGSYRASFLIRQYEVVGETDVIKTPSYLTEDLFGYTGCICGDGPNIKWVDDPVDDSLGLVVSESPRINVTAYDDKGAIMYDELGKKMLDWRLWRCSRL